MLSGRSTELIHRLELEPSAGQLFSEPEPTGDRQVRLA